jgi:hypothetical protein
MIPSGTAVGRLRSAGASIATPALSSANSGRMPNHPWLNHVLEALQRAIGGVQGAAQDADGVEALGVHGACAVCRPWLEDDSAAVDHLRQRCGHHPRARRNEERRQHGIAFVLSASSPTRNSRLISSPTPKKKTAISPSLIQWRTSRRTS